MDGELLGFQALFVISLSPGRKSGVFIRQNEFLQVDSNYFQSSSSSFIQLTKAEKESNRTQNEEAEYA